MAGEQDSAQDSVQQQKNRRVLLGIFGIPALVFIFSSGLYYLVNSGALELGTVNNGELVTPPLPLTDLPLQRVDGSDFDYSLPEPKWTFLVIGDSVCTGECERMLYVARQSIVAMGKKMHEVRLAYLTETGEIADSLQQRLDEEYRGTEVFTVNSTHLQGLFADSAASTDQPRSFFVIDPRGWLMMYYQVADTQQDTLNTLGKAVVKDMKRLIK